MLTYSDGTEVRCGDWVENAECRASEVRKMSVTGRIWTLCDGDCSVIGVFDERYECPRRSKPRAADGSEIEVGRVYRVSADADQLDRIGLTECFDGDIVSVVEVSWYRDDMDVKVVPAGEETQLPYWVKPWMLVPAKEVGTLDGDPVFEGDVLRYVGVLADIPFGRKVKVVDPKRVEWEDDGMDTQVEYLNVAGVLGKTLKRRIEPDDVAFLSGTQYGEDAMRRVIAICAEEIAAKLNEAL